MLASHLQGTKATRSMILNDPDIHRAKLMRGLRKMKKLRLLCVYDDDLLSGKWKTDEGVQYLPDTLRSLHWFAYPFCCLPKTFQANNLVNIEMTRSYISQLWEGGETKVLEKIRFVDLSFSKLRTFNLGMTRNLETLDLRNCNDMAELQMPSKLPKLKDLILSHSKVSNRGGPEKLDLTTLNLIDCYYLQEIHAPMGCLKKLTRLNLSGCLRFEYVRVNTQYFSPPVDSLAKLELIAESLGRCPFHPNSNLPKFKFQCKYGEVLPSSSGNLEKLLSFGPCACTNLDSFSASICGLKHLIALTLDGNIPEAPKDLWKLASLEVLTLSMKEIKQLPDNICMLKHLKSLDLKSCWLLEKLPMDLGGLECLEELHLTDCVSLRDIPDSICNMKCLRNLHLSYCIQVEKLPEELGRLESLKLLNIEGTGIGHLPESIFRLKDLRIIGSTWWLKSYGFTFVTDISTNIASCYISDYFDLNL
ncbi:hypothetical protein E3N88_09520 [Mikania micrantha]|uniref:Disease resistance R13L4/SHOC-2-like LRR domain-containing protein n=1 Tax=Mikania micrantha TaxID=192012 RepID=A0A5N6PJC7_9ASTR|nr:hypothetical protein E3N88_09520 [Mikania micrantha]